MLHDFENSKGTWLLLGNVVEVLNNTVPTICSLCQLRCLLCCTNLLHFIPKNTCNTWINQVSQNCRPPASRSAFNLMVWSLSAITCDWWHAHRYSVQPVHGAHVAERCGQKTDSTGEGEDKMRGKGERGAGLMQRRRPPSTHHITTTITSTTFPELNLNHLLN